MNVLYSFPPAPTPEIYVGDAVFVRELSAGGNGALALVTDAKALPITHVYVALLENYGRYAAGSCFTVQKCHCTRMRQTQPATFVPA